MVQKQDSYWSVQVQDMRESPHPQIKRSPVVERERLVSLSPPQRVSQQPQRLSAEAQVPFLLMDNSTNRTQRQRQASQRRTAMRHCAMFELIRGKGNFPKGNVSGSCCGWSKACDRRAFVSHFAKKKQAVLVNASARRECALLEKMEVVWARRPRS